MFVQNAGIHLPDPVFAESKPIDAFFKVIAERPAAAIQVLLAITWLELNTSVSDKRQCLYALQLEMDCHQASVSVNSTLLIVHQVLALLHVLHGEPTRACPEPECDTSGRAICLHQRNTAHKLQHSGLQWLMSSGTKFDRQLVLQAAIACKR